MTAVRTTTAPAPEHFAVHLDVFSGPFELLLGLIAKHELDITEVALSQVTDEFIGHTRRLGGDGDLEQTTQFLVVAATLLDLKAAKLLPRGEVEDEDDLAVLEARDLLFARLLQYRAFQQVANTFSQRLSAEERRHPRAVTLEPRFAELLPDVLLTLTPDRFAELASRTLAPRPPPPELALGHMYAPAVSVREQTEVVADRLRTATSMTFRALVADAPDTTTTVARFLGLLNLFRDGVVGFDQTTPLGELHVRWTGTTADTGDATDE